MGVEQQSLAAEACAREPIHRSGAIQPHGVLVSCMLPEWRIRHVSANAGSLFDVPAGMLLGQTLTDLLADDVLKGVADALGFVEEGMPPQRAAAGNIGAFAQVCDISVHVSEGLVHLEFEPQLTPPPPGTPTYVAQRMIAQVASAGDEDEFHARVAAQVRALTGYDRVMVYRFRHDDAGEVIAESRHEAMEPYLGLRYPASDIPAQARALYVRNRLRVIPDAGYVPVPILPEETGHGHRLDLSQHALRSVAPVHLEYLRNMGVAASMSISIVVDDRLWGLIACHHRAPRLVPPAVRAAADLFGTFVSMRVAARQQEQALRAEDHARAVRARLANALLAGGQGLYALPGHLDLIHAMLPCDGVGLWLDHRWTAHGHAPQANAIAPLMDWVHTANPGATHDTDDARAWRPAGVAQGQAGVMALPLGGTGDCLFLFRAEQIEDVSWAGDPHKSTVPGDDGVRIAPRRSFAEWRETVRGRSVSWSESDRQIADRLVQELRQLRLQTAAAGANVTDLDAYRRRHALRDQRSRLDHLAALLEGMVHLDDEESARLGARIAELEVEFHRLMADTDDAAD